MSEGTDTGQILSPNCRPATARSLRSSKRFLCTQIQPFFDDHEETDTHMLDFMVFDHTSAPVAATFDVLE